MTKTALVRWRAYGLLLLTTVLWGAALIIVKPAFEFTTPFRFLWYRFMIAGTLAFPFFIYYLPKIKNLGPTLLKIIGFELIGCTATLALLYTGLDHTSALEASVLATMTPVFTTLLCFWILKEKIEKHERLGLLIAFIGTLALTVIPMVAYASGFGTFSLFGNSLVFVQNIIQASFFVFAKKTYKPLPKLFTSAVSFFVGAMSFFLLSLFEVQLNWSSLMHAMSVDLQSKTVLMSVVYMAIFGSLIALTAITKAQSEIEISEASLFHYLQPLVYLPLGVMLLGETLSSVQIGLMILILVGVAIAEIRFRTKRKARYRSR